jgi:hypothetical protein
VHHKHLEQWLRYKKEELGAPKLDSRHKIIISKRSSILQYLDSPCKTKNCRWWCYSDLRNEATIPIFQSKFVQFSSANYWKPKSIRRLSARKSISSASAYLQECYESYNRPHSMLCLSQKSRLRNMNPTRIYWYPYLLVSYSENTWSTGYLSFYRRRLMSFSDPPWSGDILVKRLTSLL